MECPGCGKEVTAAYRGLVVTSYCAHPVVNGKPDLNATVATLTPYEREFQDGAYGVCYACPECDADVTALLDE